MKAVLLFVNLFFENIEHSREELIRIQFMQKFKGFVILFVLNFLIYSNYISAQDIALPSNYFPSDSMKSHPPVFLDYYIPASRAIRANNINSGIQSLEKFVELNPRSSFKEYSIYILGRLYTKIKRDDLAYRAFESLLDSGANLYGQYLGRNSEKKADLLDTIQDETSKGYKYAACLRLHEIAIKEHHYDEAVRFLNDADKKYPANFGGCGNAYLMYKGQLNLKFAELYLIMKDTLKATEKLWSCIFDREGYPVKAVRLLHNILHSKFNNRQIIEGINKAISEIDSAKRILSGKVLGKIEVNILDVTIRSERGFWFADSKFKNELETDQCIMALKAEKYTPPKNIYSRIMEEH